MSASGEPNRDLDALVEQLVGDGLSADQHARLAAILRGDTAEQGTAARRRYLQLLNTHSMLREEFGAAIDPILQAESDTKAESGKPQAEDAATRQSPVAAHPSLRSWNRSLSRHRFGIGIAAGLLFVATLLSWAAFTYLPNVAKKEVSSDEQVAFVAQLVRQVDTKWKVAYVPDPNTKEDRPIATGVKLYPGQKLSLVSGLARIQFGNGAEVVLQGPAELEVNSRKACKLEFGKMVARADEARSKGFLVETPTSMIEDLGTEFGVDVLHGGTSRLHVFEGEVRVDGTGIESSIVSAGEGVFVEAGKLTAISTSSLAGRFIRAMPLSQQVTINTRVLIDEGFSTGHADGTTWTSHSNGVSAGQEWVWSASEGHANPVGTEVWQGAAGAKARALSDTYDHDLNTASPNIEVRGAIEVMSLFEDNSAPLATRVGVRVRLPEDVDEKHAAMLTAFVANRISSAMGGQSPRVSVVNVTDARTLVEPTALTPFSPHGNTGWNYKAVPVRMTAEDAGDEIEVRFDEKIVGGKNAAARGLQVADVRFYCVVREDVESDADTIDQEKR